MTRWKRRAVLFSVFCVVVVGFFGFFFNFEQSLLPCGQVAVASVHQLRHRHKSFRCTNNMCRRLHHQPNYSNHCADPFPIWPDSWGLCLSQSFDPVPMPRHRFRRYFDCCRWLCRCHCNDRYSSSDDCADALSLGNVCILLCNCDHHRRCYYYFYFVLGCCANVDLNCAISVNDPSTRMNIDTIVVANFVCCICAIFDCAKLGWLAAGAMSMHRDCRDFCNKIKWIRWRPPKSKYYFMQRYELL